jgi:hypothetical protein
MKWTTELPTQPGLYWWKFKEHLKPTPVVLEESGYLETGFLPSEVEGVWYGPILPP